MRVGVGLSFGPHYSLGWGYCPLDRGICPAHGNTFIIIGVRGNVKIQEDAIKCNCNHLPPCATDGNISYI